MAQNDFENKRDTADQKIDLRLWKRLIAYAMRHRRTVVSVMLVLLVVAAIDLALPAALRAMPSTISSRAAPPQGLWACAALSMPPSWSPSRAWACSCLRARRRAGWKWTSATTSGRTPSPSSSS